MHSKNPFIPTIIATFLVVLSAVPALAQNPKLDLARFDKVGGQPASSVKIDIDERPLLWVLGRSLIERTRLLIWAWIP